MLKNIASRLRNTSGDTVLVVGAAIGGKANILVMVSDNLVKEKNLNAAAIIREISGEIAGGGGGQPSVASAGGKNPDGIPAAIKKAGDYIQRMV